MTRAATALGLASVFVIATFGGVAAHLDSPTSRRLVQRGVNYALGIVFQGKIVVEQLDHISIRGAEIASAVALDPSGQQVIRATGIRARANVLAIAQNVLFDSGDIHIVIPYARIEHGEVLVEMRPSKRVDLEETFELRHKPEPEPPNAPKKPSRLVSVDLQHIELGTAWVHGEIAQPRALDADVSRLTASLHAGPDGVALDVEQTGIVDRAFLPARTSGVADYHLRAAPLRMWTSFEGQVADVDVVARAVMDEKHISATADAPKATPEQLASLIPGVPLRGPIAAHAEIDGTVPDFDVNARVEASDTHGKVDARGRLDARGPARLDLDLRAEDVDPRLFGRDLPDGQLSGTARLSAELGGDLPRFATDAHTEPTALNGTFVPAADVHVVVDRGNVTGMVHLDEPGMPIDGRFDFASRDGLRFDARTRIDAIHAAPRIAGPVDGSARIHVTGKLDGGQLDAKVDGAISGFKAPGNVTLANATVSGKIRGPVTNLSVDASASGHDMRAGGYDFDDVAVRASGPIASPRIEAKLNDANRGYVHATGQLDARDAAVNGIAVEIGRDDNVVKGAIRSVSAKGGGVSVEGIALKGDAVGDVEGRLAVQGNDLTGTLKGDGVDLERLGKLAGIPYRLKGVANVDVALERGARGHRGHVQLELEDGQVAMLPGVSALVTANIQDDQIEADGLVRLIAKDDAGASDKEVRCDGSIAQVRLSNGHLAIRGPLLSPSTWRTMTGSAEIAAEDWNLRCLKRLVPFGLPVSDVRGFATVRANVSRSAGDRTISVKNAELKTRGLELIGPTGADDEPAWESRSIDVAAKGDFDGSSGKAHGEVALYDDALIVSGSADMSFDLHKLLDPATRRAAFETAPLSARISVPRRSFKSFATLPSFARDRVPPLTGDVRLDGYVDGTVTEPFLVIRTIGWNVAYADRSSSEEANRWALPVDVDALLTYDSSKATLDAHVTHGGAEIVSANAELSAKLDDLVHPRDGKVPWTGGFYAKLKEVPIGDVPFFADHDIAGHLSGSVSMAHEKGGSKLALDLELPDVQVGQDLYFENGKVSARIEPSEDGTQNLGKAEVELVSQDGGRLNASAYAGIIWRDDVIPTIDDKGAGAIAAKLSRFRLAAAYPLVSGELSKLDGYVDGNAKIDWSRIAEGDRGAIDADLTVTEGTFHVPQIGQEFRHAHVHVEALSDARREALRKATGHDVTMQCGPRTVTEAAICFRDLGAEGISGVVRGWALARVDGLKLKDRSEDGRNPPMEGELTIAKGEELPITVEGVPIGKARGEFVLGAEKRDNTIALSVDVPRMHLELPATSRRNLQALDENPDFKISHALGPEKQPRSPDALRYVVNVFLDDVRIEGTGIDARMTTSRANPPHVELTDKARVTGDVQLVEGSKFEVFGKQFEIQRGVVHMRPEDTGNPDVNVTAFWDAPDGTRVYVDYVGLLNPVTSEKLRFRSNPPHTQQELVAALLFGADLSHDTGPGTGQAAAGGAAAGVGGGIAADQFRALVSGIPLLNRLSPRIGTTEEGQLKTSVVYQVSERISLTASFAGASNSTAQASGTQATTTGGPEAQRSGRTEGSIDWHFHKNWLLRGSVGYDSSTPTSGVDLLWQYRY